VELVSLCDQIAARLQKQSAMLATAESCTGGWIAKTITDCAGSSKWFDRGFVTYSNDAKVEMLNINPESLATFGAVSEQIASEMAVGAISHSRSSCAIAVTGIAGPDGGTKLKPVGTVCFAWAVNSELVKSETGFFSGDREKIRYQTVEYALRKLLTLI